MRTLMTALAISAAFSGAAVAQDAARWQGFYAGLATTIIAPEFDNTNLQVPLQEGTGMGLFGGYNHAITNNFVLGAEVGFTGPTAFETTLVGPDFEFDNVVNARIRGGYALGNAMVYGSLGYQQVNYSDAAGIATSGSADGIVYGIGIEMFLAETVSVRIDYTSTHMEPEEGTILGNPAAPEIDANAIGLGVALHF